MTVEVIEKDGVTYRLLYGFGKIQKARFILASNLPESLKRIALAGGEIEDSDLKQVPPDEALAYSTKTNTELVKLVLVDASDKLSQVSIDEYVDSYLPEEVGKQIADRIREVTRSQVEKKQSP